ncbi:dTDP-4-dehydrorhamnose 3,5-epimerase [Acaryochloris thomasi RCC1774]|uniref:dTDP-4-dehydrorhamnose 3,5-epimerase n=1 Tax=Acaryochloris thomasi RCC1774 TaxID=1764569 RepID=A0A2W1JNQ8_9CYAN|nr:dTDP-4-dehydrorhamnose 3,5-epimerase [Acaryochloris thomasi]PZD73075.1 dTDP-4-dehydrorhamnose 3,5-epimerase [Acaryochloris thomasi RCC1774]
MIFTKTAIQGVYIIDLELREDDRGGFARTFCAQEFEAHELKPTFVQCNLSFNHQKGTLRGMHYQTPPATEVKLVRCTQGAVYDVIIDLRPDSPTYLTHVGVELTAENRRAFYVPEMFAHGYQTLTDNAEVTYQVSEFYTPGHEQGLRHSDPGLKIDWPLPVTMISEKDANWALLKDHPLSAGISS